mmetsp:Transcript_41475/g.115264  ORF Transcript_41475/g.115264 Transcript_41475/m.115264 type:complete len:228 (+) Transcript_41475:257-940(+)
MHSRAVAALWGLMAESAHCWSPRRQRGAPRPLLSLTRVLAVLALRGQRRLPHSCQRSHGLFHHRNYSLRITSSWALRSCSLLPCRGMRTCQMSRALRSRQMNRNGSGVQCCLTVATAVGAPQSLPARCSGALAGIALKPRCTRHCAGARWTFPMMIAASVLLALEHRECRCGRRCLHLRQTGIITVPCSRHCVRPPCLPCRWMSVMTRVLPASTASPQEEQPVLSIQ